MYRKTWVEARVNNTFDERDVREDKHATTENSVFRGCLVLKMLSLVNIARQTVKAKMETKNAMKRFRYVDDIMYRLMYLD